MPAPDHRVVVDEEDADRAVARSASIAALTARPGRRPASPPRAGSIGAAPLEETAAPRIASAPTSLDRDERLGEQPRREGDADDRLEQHEDAGPGAADGPDAGEEPERRDGRREDAR